MIVHGGVGAGGAILGDLHALILRRPVSATSADADDELRWSWVALHAEGTARRRVRTTPSAHATLRCSSHTEASSEAAPPRASSGHSSTSAPPSERPCRRRRRRPCRRPHRRPTVPRRRPERRPSRGRAPSWCGRRSREWRRAAAADAPTSRGTRPPRPRRRLRRRRPSASGALLSHYSRRTHVLDVHALTWTRLHGEAPPRPLAAAADDAAAAAEAPAADGSVAPPPQREQAGVAAIPLASCGSEAVLVSAAARPSRAEA